VPTSIDFTWLYASRASVPDSEEIVAIGGEVTAESLLKAYRMGIFPMHIRVDLDEASSDSDDVDVEAEAEAWRGADEHKDAHDSDVVDVGDDDDNYVDDREDDEVAAESQVELLAWWSPNPRGILPLHGLRIPRSLAKSCRKFTVTNNEAFAEVLHACADKSREGTWIRPDFIDAYLNLHDSGFAHSFETRNAQGELVGGLVCVEVGGLVCGDSMFHSDRDASKVALVALVEHLQAAPHDPRLPGGRLLDTQWQTDHLSTLGVVTMSRADYQALLPIAMAMDAALT
jgi:leucyl/phenylalanyl-tRNA--protein transferase